MYSERNANVSVTVGRSEEHTSELQSHHDLVCRLLLEKKNIPSARGAERQRVAHVRGGGHTPELMLPATAVRLIPPRVHGRVRVSTLCPCFFFNDPAPPEIYPLSLHDALPISYLFDLLIGFMLPNSPITIARSAVMEVPRSEEHTSELQSPMYLVCRLLLAKKRRYGERSVLQYCPRVGTARLRLHVA